MERSTLTDPQAWAQETFGAAELGDPRRTKRLLRVAAQMAADPQGSLPRQMGGDWAALKAAYRLLGADGVSHEAISRPVWQQTRQHLEERGLSRPRWCEQLQGGTAGCVRQDVLDIADRCFAASEQLGALGVRKWIARAEGVKDQPLCVLFRSCAHLLGDIAKSAKRFLERLGEDVALGA